MGKKKKVLYSRSSFALIILIILVIIFVTTFIKYSGLFEGKYIEVINAIISMIGIFFVGYQLKREKDIKEAEFLINLNESFLSDEDRKKVYNALEYYLNKKDTKLLKELSNGEIVSYLSFFESFYALISRGILRIDMLDDLFSYRFFIVANNPYIQDVELIKYQDYYKNFYKLYDKWISYKKMYKSDDINSLEIFSNENRLDIRNKSYEKLIR